MNIAWWHRLSAPTTLWADSYPVSRSARSPGRADRAVQMHLRYTSGIPFMYLAGLLHRRQQRQADRPRAQDWERRQRIC